MRRWLLVFAAGALGALVSALAMWLAGRYGLTQSLGVRLAPALSAHWLYPRIVWGGLWGFLFLLPLFGSRWLLKSAVLALVVSLIQLFVIYPYTTPYGVAGLELGMMMPVVTYIFAFIWALAAAISLRLS
ncbi:hypothetical protein [Gilvimarinus polysaccharolyticus]|uniref:hypothetical protein n=1 Tax=Gilvimarinus polysaccharolyticus TaxID=863921 RepID=UPI0006733C0B|nr:hypothetical protein [Gilvimarinus polysaccharolyticus]